MSKSIICPQCGATMDKEPYSEKYICPYCDEVIYPEKKEESAQPVYVPNEELIARSVAKRLAAERKAKEEAEEEMQKSSSGATVIIWIIVIVIVIGIIGSL